MGREGRDYWEAQLSVGAAEATDLRAPEEQVGCVDDASWCRLHKVCPLPDLWPVEGLMFLCGEVSPLGDVFSRVSFDQHLLSQLVGGGAILVKNACPGIPERTLFPSLW